MEMTMMIGYIAGTLTTISFVPQVIRTWRMKETRDLSLAMLLFFAIGVCLWAVYGFWIDSLPVIAANLISLVLILILLWLKLRYR
jgi:MtN3 and saliva related transmembrane protein